MSIEQNINHLPSPIIDEQDSNGNALQTWRFGRSQFLSVPGKVFIVSLVVFGVRGRIADLFEVAVGDLEMVGGSEERRNCKAWVRDIQAIE